MAIEDGIAREHKCRRITKTVTQLIVGTRSYFDAEARGGERIDVSQPLKRTAACLAFSIRTVKKVCKILRDGIELPSDGDDEERNRERTVSKTIYSAVRSALFGMYREKWHATLDSLLKVLETQHSTRAISWVWSRATLHRILTQEMFFTYGARRQSLQSYQREVLHRSAACAPLSRGGKSCVLPSMWLDQGSDGGVKILFGTGMRFNVCHAGNEAGFVPGAELTFRGKTLFKAMTIIRKSTRLSSWIGWRRECSLS